MGICCWIKRIGKISCLLENYQKQTAEWRRWNTVSHNQRWKFQVLQCQCISQMHSTKFHWNMCQLTNWNLNPTKLDPNENIAWIVPAGIWTHCGLSQWAPMYSLEFIGNLLGNADCLIVCEIKLSRIWRAGLHRPNRWKYTTMECHINGNQIKGYEVHLIFILFHSLT